MTIGISTYLIYLAISIALTIWVARTLHKNGRVFLVDVFHGNDALADSVNHLLVVGFYLINFGYVSLALKLGYEVATAQEAMEALSVKIGMVPGPGVAAALIRRVLGDSRPDRHEVHLHLAGLVGGGRERQADPPVPDPAHLCRHDAAVKDLQRQALADVRRVRENHHRARG